MALLEKHEDIKNTVDIHIYTERSSLLAGKIISILVGVVEAFGKIKWTISVDSISGHVKRKSNNTTLFSCTLQVVIKRGEFQYGENYGIFKFKQWLIIVYIVLP